MSGTCGDSAPVARRLARALKEIAGHDVPAGWHRVGKEGTKEECSAFVDEVWTDMRPRSLREAMDGATTQ